MNPRKFIILGFALVAALSALFLVRTTLAQRSAAPEAHADATQGDMVLAALADIPAGSAVRANQVGWVGFPPGSVNDAFIRQAADPEALEKLDGSVARTDIVKGEPITKGRLVKPGDQGFFAALLAPGNQAVAIKIDSESAVAGYISPNDRVDVIATRKMDGGGVRSDLLLTDVRVLSVGDEFREKTGSEPKQNDAHVATLEVSPPEAQALAQAQAAGDIVLALRSIGSSPSGRKSALGASSEGVTIHAFGEVVSSGAKGGR